MPQTRTTPTSYGEENNTGPLPNFNTLSLSSNSLSSSSAMDDNLHHLPLQKVTISGATLSCLINRFSSSPSNIEGLLFGKFSLQSASLCDDDDNSSSSSLSSSSSSSLSAVITAFITGDVVSLLRRNNHRHVIGWFSGRRRSPLRPSLREFAISHSLSSDHSSRVFLLLTTPLNDSQSQSQTLIHTHEYRVHQYGGVGNTFDATTMDVVNIGPAFRGHYGAFSPNSEIPHLPCEFHGGSPMREDGKERENMNLKDMKRVAKDQKELEAYVEGYELGGLSRLMGGDAVSYMNGVEELYEKMLAKLHSLASQVESSSAKVLEMENHNMKLRHRVAGLE